MEERREARKKRGDVETSVEVASPKKQTSKSEVNDWQPKNVYLKDINKDIKHCIGMIEQHRTNKRYAEEAIAHYGSFSITPISFRNDLRHQEDEIKRWCRKLKDLIEEG